MVFFESGDVQANDLLWRRHRQGGRCDRHENSEFNNLRYWIQTISWLMFPKETPTVQHRDMVIITQPSKELSNRHRDILVCLFLVTACICAYWQVINCDFVNFDDPKYITENVHIQSGLTLESLNWAFTSTYASNWHPLTWLSHMLDFQFYGMNPGRHHLTNLLLHLANALLLYVVFRKMTGSLWQSGIVAALFAIHPLHVESVAWVSERKDVLSTFFWMLTMGSYTWYVANPAVTRYLLVGLFFVLGLMSKPMLVTLPFVLLLLDFWPFYRFRFKDTDENGGLQQKAIAVRLILEKIPLFVLSALSSTMTFYAQKHGGSVISLDVIPLKARIANALVAYVAYIGNMVYPAKLAALYPFYGDVPYWKIAGACLLLVAVSLLAFRVIKRRPYVTVGWLWYVGTLVPVIGVVQVGTQSMADRYTYVPLIGLFIIVAWGIPELVAKWRFRNIWLATSAAVLVAILMAVTWKQVRYWKDGITLFEHTLEVTSNNWLAHNNLGHALFKKGRIDDAIEQYLKALHLKPGHEKAHNNLGNALEKKGLFEEAVEHYLFALRINPDYAEAYNNLGNALHKQGRIEEAIERYLTALQIKPDYSGAHYNLGNALAEMNRQNEAIAHYTNALKMDPKFTDAHINIGIVLEEQGKVAEAIDHYQKALTIEPMSPLILEKLARSFKKMKKYQKAIFFYNEILKVLPENPTVYYNIACVYSLQNQTEDAFKWLTKAVANGFDDWNHIKADSDLEYIRGSSQYRELLKDH